MWELLALLVWVLLALMTVAFLWQTASFASYGGDLPARCPRCGAGGDEVEPVLGPRAPWWTAIGRGRYACRTCRTAFREHASGVVVEEHD